jgi:hypothetical protein
VQPIEYKAQFMVRQSRDAAPGSKKLVILDKSGELLPPAEAGSSDKVAAAGARETKHWAIAYCAMKRRKEAIAPSNNATLVVPPACRD